MTNTSTDHAPTPAGPSPFGSSVLRPLAYHRLLQSSAQGARWWRPLAVVGATVGLYFAFVLPLLIVTVVAMEGTFGDRLSPLRRCQEARGVFLRTRALLRQVQEPARGADDDVDALL